MDFNSRRSHGSNFYLPLKSTSILFLSNGWIPTCLGTRQTTMAPTLFTWVRRRSGLQISFCTTGEAECYNNNGYRDANIFFFHFLLVCFFFLTSSRIKVVLNYYELLALKLRCCHGQLTSFLLVTISTDVRRLSRRLQFRALCCQWRQRPTSCRWKRSQLSVTTTRFSRWNLVIKLSPCLTQLIIVVRLFHAAPFISC